MSFIEIMWLVNAPTFYKGLTITLAIVGVLVALKVLFGRKGTSEEENQIDLVSKVGLFEITVPGEKPEQSRTHYFTDADAVVTVKGQQYLPLNAYDAVKWGLKQGPTQ